MDAATLFPKGAGQYQLEVRLGEARIAMHSFAVLPFADCVAAARAPVKQNAGLGEAGFSSVDHRGIAGPLEVVAEDFRQIKVCLALEVPQAEPLLDVVELTLGFVLRRQNAVIHSAWRNLSLASGRQPIQANLDVTPGLFLAGPGNYRLELFLDNRLLLQTEFRHKTRAQIKAEKAEVILQSLSLTEPRLFAFRDGTRVETEHVFETDTAVVLTFGVCGSGFDEDVPAVKWRLKVKWVNLDSGEVREEQRFLCAKAGENRHEDLESPLHGAGRGLSAGRYRLQLLKRKELLTEFQFRILSKAEIVPYTEKAVLASLRVERAQLFVQAGSIRYPSQLVPGTSDFILPELTIRTAGYNSFLAQLQTPLQLLLVRGGGQRTPLAAWPVALSAAPLVLRNLAVKVRGGSWGVTPGACRLVLTLADRELASLPFQIVSREEVLQRVKASVVTLEAIGRSGRQELNPAALRFGEHEAFGVAVEIEVGILAPNVSVECGFLLKRDHVVVGRAHSELQLDRPRQQLRGAKVRLAAVAQPQSRAPQVLDIVVVIGGQEKDTRSVSIINGQHISNCEGQLTIDPHHLEVDACEYEAILRRL